jgi:hypothetical protein
MLSVNLQITITKRSSVLLTMHRPFSSLVYHRAELSTTAFQAPSPFSIPSVSGRSAHTARALKAAELQTKLLAIPCTIEKHNLFTMCICSHIATAQISACNNLLEDHALSVARERVKLSIGFLNVMGSIWASGKAMAKDVRVVARSTLCVSSSTVTIEPDTTAEIEIQRNELFWPIDPSAGIDIYSGIVLPMNWEYSSSGYAASSLIHAPMFQSSGKGESTTYRLSTHSNII